MQIDIFNMQREKVGSIDLADDVFGAEGQGAPLLRGREGAARAKRAGHPGGEERAQRCSGSTQEALQAEGHGPRAPGLVRAPDYVGGGVVFGPHPRSYEYTVPKKVKRAALASALSQRAKERKLVVVDKLTFDAPKTKQMAGILKTLGLAKALVVDEKANENLFKSMRNCEGEGPRARGRQRLRPPEPQRPRHRDGRPQAGRKARAAAGARVLDPGGRVGATMRTPEQVIKRPLLTEKGTLLKETGGNPSGELDPETVKSQLLFEVAKDANKVEIRHAVEKLLNVNVISVRTSIVRGKEKRIGRFVGKTCKLEEGHRDPRARPEHRVLRGRLARSSARSRGIRDFVRHNATTPGSRGRVAPDF